jgi:hypothetical protein
MMDLLSIKHPATDYSVHVRSQIANYVDGICATMGLAVMNQAWLQEQYDSLKVYSDPVMNYTLDAVTDIYNIIGATYPISADRELPLLHTIGQEEALVSYPYLALHNWSTGPSDGGMTKISTTVQHDNLIRSLGSADVDIWNGVTKQEWMDKNGFIPFMNNTGERWPSTFFIFDINNRKWKMASRIFREVTLSRRVINGNIFTKQYNSRTYYKVCRSNEPGCNGKNDREAKDEETMLLKQQNREANRHYCINKVTMNGYGMPALMNPEYIAQERDGIVVNSCKQEITSSGVQKIILTVVDHYGSKANGAYRIIDPATGKVVMCYFSDSSSIYLPIVIQVKSFSRLGTRSPETPCGDRDACDMVVRQTTLVDDLEDGEVQIVLDRN